MSKWGGGGEKRMCWERVIQLRRVFECGKKNVIISSYSEKKKLFLEEILSRENMQKTN